MPNADQKMGCEMLVNAAINASGPLLRYVDFAHETVRPVGPSARELRWQIRDPRITIGRGTYGAPNIIMYSADDRLEIGNYSSIAGGSFLLAGGEHNTRCVSSFPFAFHFGQDAEALSPDPTKVRYRGAVHKGPLRIGSDVWIGFGALVLSGVTVGHGAVIGAGAVVASDVPPYSIVVGNPGRVIRRRFDDDIITELLKVRWWDWSVSWVRHYQPLLLGEPRIFLSELNRLDESELQSYRGADASLDAMESELVPQPRPLRLADRIKTAARLVLPPLLYKGMKRVKKAMSVLSAGTRT